MWFFSIVCLAWFVHSIFSSSTKSDLYDVIDDPYEKTDLMTNSAYQSTLNSLEKEAALYFDAVGDPDVPAPIDKSVWKEAGGVVPWVDEETKLRNDITTKYSYDSAPNIVFVLVDDWGWNDIGYHSTYMPFTTPNIDKLAAEGIKLENYYSAFLCTPARASFLTGRYPLRYSMYRAELEGELPLNEYSIAEELQSAGYRTYMVGKWHVGYSSVSRTPTYRGFDYFYGYYNGFIDYYTKEYSGDLDLSENTSLVTDPNELSDSLHAAILFETKVEKLLDSHSATYNDQPFFLYYSLQLMHGDWEADQLYIDRCHYDGSDSNLDIYCGMNLMLDEVIGNLTCAINRNGFSDNTILVVASDNGALPSIPGANYPYLGAKGSTHRGGISVPAFIHSKLIPESRRGTSYSDYVHVTDWLPSFMHIATNGEWTGSYGGPAVVIDGINVWDAIIKGTDSPRTSMIHLMDNSSSYAMQSNEYKLNYQCTNPNDNSPPNASYTVDKNPDASYVSCDEVSLVDFTA